MYSPVLGVHFAVDELGSMELPEYRILLMKETPEFGKRAAYARKVSKQWMRDISIYADFVGQKLSHPSHVCSEETLSLSDSHDMNDVDYFGHMLSDFDPVNFVDLYETQQNYPLVSAKNNLAREFQLLMDNQPHLAAQGTENSDSGMPPSVCLARAAWRLAYHDYYESIGHSVDNLLTEFDCRASSDLEALARLEFAKWYQSSLLESDSMLVYLSGTNCFQ